MTSPVFALYITCLFLGKTAQTNNLELSKSDQPEHRFVSVKTGEKLMLHCSYEGNNAEWFYWYKQSLGQKPRLIAGYSKHQTKANFYHEFIGDPRFTMDMVNTKSKLTIRNLHLSDSATYYCGGSYPAIFEFVEVITVSVEGSGVTVPALVHQSVSETIQPGETATLSCTVHTGTCDGEHSVYWFKHSEESHPGLIYTHGGRNDQCERKDNTQTHTCVYNLPLKDLDVSHSGTYYCAVASCGHTLFGNGIKLDFKDDRALVYFLSSALAFTTVLVIILAFSVYRINKRSSSQSPESQAGCSSPSSAKREDLQDADRLYYAALSANLTKRPRRQRDQTWTECVYYSVQQ